MAGNFETNQTAETKENIPQAQQDRQELVESIAQLSQHEINPQKVGKLQQLAPKVIDLFDGMDPKPTHEDLSKINPETGQSVFQETFSTLSDPKVQLIENLFAQGEKTKGAITNFFSERLQIYSQKAQKEIDIQKGNQKIEGLTQNINETNETAENVEKQLVDATKTLKDNIFKNHDVECTPADKTAQLDKLGMTEEELQSKIDNSKYSNEET